MKTGIMGGDGIFGIPERTHLAGPRQEQSLNEDDKQRISSLLQGWFALRASDCVGGQAESHTSVPTDYKYPSWLN